MTRPILFLILAILPRLLDAADTEDIRQNHAYIMSGAPCSTREDVEDYGRGDWVRCVLNKNGALALHWRTWTPEGKLLDAMKGK